MNHQNQQYKFKSILVYALELIAFLSITAFCLGAWLTAPQKIFSLRKSLENQPEFIKSISNYGEFEFVEVRLPTDFAEQYSTESLNALRLYQSLPPLNPNEKPGNKLVFDLHAILEHAGIETNQPVALFFYMTGLNQRPSVYRAKIDVPDTIRDHLKAGPRIPSGGIIWRDSFSYIQNVPDNTKLTIDAFALDSKGYMCDFSLYSASGLLIWPLEE